MSISIKYVGGPLDGTVSTLAHDAAPATITVAVSVRDTPTPDNPSTFIHQVPHLYQRDNYVLTSYPPIFVYAYVGIKDN